MAKKNKKKSRNQNQQKHASPKQEEKDEIRIVDVEASKTESEFEKNKEEVIEKYIDDIDILEKEKKSVEKAVEKAKNLCDELEEKRSALANQKKELQTSLNELKSDYDAIKENYDTAVAKIKTADAEAKKIVSSAVSESEKIKKEAKTAADTIQSNADTKAQKVLDKAEKERIEKLSKASDEARDAWKVESDNLKKQIDDISAREKELHDVQLKLDKERLNFDFEKEALDEIKAHVNKLKEKYLAVNPSRILELELELSDEQDKYQILLERYESLSKQLKEAQVLLDTIKTEVEDTAGGTKKVSLSLIVSEMQDFKKKYEELSVIKEKYPDGESIALLEEKAQKADRIERINDTLELERNRYREEAVAARNANNELKVIKQEVEATNALNEHLLQELEKNKTALESRTGDTCPSLSKVDNETEESEFINDINKRTQTAAIKSLKEMVSHVKNYAGSRDEKEHLFYKDNYIRAFLAGMAVSRLIILQGMSGTGKSSLPRIFSESISGFNKLIPVESSWRDRNELLGYYNDFNKKFNAKSFTIELYKSSKKICREIPTFIVLDEMNLARIEYYFSDFLSILQEPDHDKWLIELVSSDMRTLPMELTEEVKQKMKKDEPTVFAIWERLESCRQGNLKSAISDEDKEQLTGYLAKLGKLTGAKDLIDGRKIKVTYNIWFVGTANKDESTFEISDKVYDRAQVVTLNEKGVDEKNYKHTNKKYISVTELQKLFDTAISGFDKKKAVEEKLKALDKILIENFDASFGNRIVNQTIEFAAVFTASGGSLEDALDYQISTKILRKVISSDNVDAFQVLQGETKDYCETHKLISKRIKDLEH